MSAQNAEIGEMAINIVVDDSDAPQTILVEVENDNGESLNIGTWINRNDGLRSLRITAADIVKHIKI